jgi:hypothetical protein
VEGLRIEKAKQEAHKRDRNRFNKYLGRKIVNHKIENVKLPHRLHHEKVTRIPRSKLTDYLPKEARVSSTCMSALGRSEVGLPTQR